jgi:membrane protein YqaA with SNARE-associated domain
MTEALPQTPPQTPNNELGCRVSDTRVASLEVGQRRRGWLRRLYDWVISWADTPYGTPALAVISFAESSFFPIPPDVLQIALSVSRPRRSFYYAAVSAVASVLGAVLGFWLGYACWTALAPYFMQVVPGFTQENFNYVGRLYEQNAMLAIVGAAFTPIPFKVFTVAAGVFHEFISLPVLIVGSAIGRSARFFLVATVTYWFGPAARGWLERNFEWATLLLFALVVLGFVAIKFLV